jgi:hypothetical protein
VAIMIPDIDPALIENSGERRFYEAARALPDVFSVFYSYKFTLGGGSESHEYLYEADFIIVHPRLGYLVVEIKGGQYRYVDNEWQRQMGQDFIPAKNDPVKQASRAMFDILNKYIETARCEYFPLRFAYAVCFPDCQLFTGTVPGDLRRESIWLAEDLGRLDKCIRAVFGWQSENTYDEAVNLLINKILAPRFEVFSTMESKMKMFYIDAERILTDEQKRILDETELDRRKIYLGAAGTGKTFIAMEKVRRLVADGQKVLLTCFNRNLGAALRSELKEEVASGRLMATNFHDLLVNLLRDNDVDFIIPEDRTQRSAFFWNELHELGFDLIVEMAPEEKYDALVVDEGQDFRAEWFWVLQGLLREGDKGDFYIFADPYQKLFDPGSDYLSSFPVSRHRLTRNLRNTEAINSWLSKLIPEADLKCMHRGGFPVGFFSWNNPEEELRLVTKELGRLVSQKVQPGRVVILSPHVMAKSAFAGRNRIGEWPLYDSGARRANGEAHPANAVSFSTIRSYKGLEGDVIFLTGVRKGSQACTLNDIYVGCSRARFLLYVFHEEGYRFI